MSSAGKMNIPVTILVVFESETFIDFSNNTFPLETVLKTYFIICVEFDLFIEILNLNDRLEI